MLLAEEEVHVRHVLPDIYHPDTLLDCRSVVILLVNYLDQPSAEFISGSSLLRPLVRVLDSMEYRLTMAVVVLGNMVYALAHGRLLRQEFSW